MQLRKGKLLTHRQRGSHMECEMCGPNSDSQIEIVGEVAHDATSSGGIRAVGNEIAWIQTGNDRRGKVPAVPSHMYR